MITLFGLSLILLTYLVIQHLRHYHFLKHFHTPGIVWPIIGHSLTFANAKTIYPLMRQLAALDPERRKIAALVATQLTVFVFHPETVKPIVSSSKHINKNFQYNFFVPWLGYGLVAGSGDVWRDRRKLIKPVYSTRLLENIVRLSNKSADSLSDSLLQASCHGAKQIDISPYVYGYTLDIIVESITGQKLQDKHSYEYTECLTALLEVIFKRFISPWLWPEWIFKFTSEKRKQDRCLQFINAYGNKIIEEKRQESKNKSENENGVTFIDFFLTLRHKNGLPMTNRDILEECNTIINGGLDTTARCIIWTILLLANHPDAQEKILEEQRDIFGEETSGHIEDVKQDHLCKMKYLESCIKESLRLYPPFPTVGRSIEEEGFVLDGVPVPRGTTVYVSLFELHRNPTVWEEPDEFRPERFMAGSRMNEGLHPYAFLPFSGGPRNCIGQRVAMTKIKIVLSKLVRKIKIVKSDSVEEVEVVIDVGTKPKGEVNVLLAERTVGECNL